MKVSGSIAREHNLHHADDMQIYKQRNTDLQYVVVFLSA